MIGQFKSTDCKQESLDGPAVIEIRDAREKTDESILDNILNSTGLCQSSPNESGKPSFVGIDEGLPSVFAASANLLDE